MIWWADAAGYVASLLVFATFCMRTMIALRTAAIASNVCFIGFGIAAHVYPVLVLHLVLLPLNVYRTVEMLHLTRRIKLAVKGDLSFEPLKGFMRAARYASGDVIFKKDDIADNMYLVARGNLVIDELNITLSPGDLFGEIGIFSSEQMRTSTVRCITDVELLSIAKEHIAEICFQNPGISFYLLSLITNRLLADMAIINSRPNAARLG